MVLSLGDIQRAVGRKRADPKVYFSGNTKQAIIDCFNKTKALRVISLLRNSTSIGRKIVEKDKLWVSITDNFEWIFFFIQ